MSWEDKMAENWAEAKEEVYVLLKKAMQTADEFGIDFTDALEKAELG